MRDDLFQDSFHDHRFENFKIDPGVSASVLERSNSLFDSPYFSFFENEQKEIDLSSKQLRNLERLRDPQALVIMTGQQPELLGGPLYTLLKAFSVIRWAEKFETELKRPVVPLFWIPGNDSDLLECNQSPRPNRREHFRVDWSKVYSPQEQKDRILGEFRFHPSVLQQLFHQVTSSYSKPTVTLLQDCYREGESLVSSFKKLLSRVLGNQGLLFVDGSGEYVRKSSQAILRRVVEKRTEISTGLQEFHLKAQSSRKEPAVQFQSGLSRVFRIEGVKRYRLTENDTPDNLSPDVLSRPIVCDTIFPVLAHVLGPGEQRYFQQAEILYRTLKVERPLLLRRPQGLIHFARYQESLSRIDVQNQIPDERELQERFARLWKSSHSLPVPSYSITGIDPQFQSFVDSKVRKIINRYETSLLQQKVRDTFEFEKLWFWYGRGESQERFLPWLWVFSQGFLDQWLSQVKYTDESFQIWSVK